MRWDEPGQPVLRCVPDTDARHPAFVVARVRLGVDRIQVVVAVDEETADAAERVVRVQEVAVLVEDLDAVVAAVGDKETPLRIEGHPVRRAEFARLVADDAPLHDVLAVGENLMMRPVEPSGCLAFCPLCPSETKMSPFGAVITSQGSLNRPGSLPRTPGCPSAISTSPSGLNLMTWCPLSSVPCESVTQTLPSASTWMPWGKNEEPRAEAGQDLAGLAVELEDRVDQVFRASARKPHAAAAVVRPDVSVDRVDVDARGGAPFAPVGEIDPVGHPLRHSGSGGRPRLRDRLRPAPHSPRPTAGQPSTPASRFGKRCACS